jgi:hypothetical protein
MRLAVYCEGKVGGSSAEDCGLEFTARGGEEGASDGLEDGMGGWVDVTVKSDEGGEGGGSVVGGGGGGVRDRR